MIGTDSRSMGSRSSRSARRPASERSANSFYRVPFQRPARVIPGYVGFVPGARADTLVGGTQQQIAHQSQAVRLRPQIGREHLQRERRHANTVGRSQTQAELLAGYMPSAAQTSKPFSQVDRNDVLSSQDLYSTVNHLALATSLHDPRCMPEVSAGDYRESRPLYRTEPYGRANVGYTGFVSGKKAENIHGETFRKSLVSSDKVALAHHMRYLTHSHLPSKIRERPAYIGGQRVRRNEVVTDSMTVVPADDHDSSAQLGFYRSSWNDARRGWGVDRWVGSGVQSAGTLAPAGCQDPDGSDVRDMLTANPGRFIEGYQGYATCEREVVGERKQRADHIAGELTRKYRLRQRQR